MSVAFIYCLIDPRDDRVRYVGKANDVLRRLYGHLKDSSRRYTKACKWIKELLELGLVPRVASLQMVDANDWAAAEIYWIAHFRELESGLLNMHDGGAEPYRPNQTYLAENGRKNAQAVHSNPKRRRMWELKQKLGIALKQGYVSESTKAKMRMAAVIHPQHFSKWATI